MRKVKSRRLEKKQTRETQGESFSISEGGLYCNE